MEEEVASLINQMEDAESKTMAGMTFNKGKLWNQDAVVVQSGIGKVNMAICTQILVNIYGVDMLINTGVAGDVYKRQVSDCNKISCDKVSAGEPHKIINEREEIAVKGRLLGGCLD